MLGITNHTPLRGWIELTNWLLPWMVIPLSLPLLLLLSCFSCVQLCATLDGSSLGSSVPGILQARIREWVAISFSNAWKWKVKVTPLSCARLLVTPWTAAYQALPSMGFSRQEYWSGVPLPSPLPLLGSSYSKTQQYEIRPITNPIMASACSHLSL